MTDPSLDVPRAAVNTGAGLWSSSIVVAGRMVRRFARTPQLIVFSTIQSAVFLFVTTTILWAGMGARSASPRTSSTDSSTGSGRSPSPARPC